VSAKCWQKENCHPRRVLALGVRSMFAYSLLAPAFCEMTSST